jgi:uncharacterized protein (TIGR00255 family)
VRVLASMTGFGDARGEAGGTAVAVEVRAVNNRHLKVTVRGTDPYPLLDADVEKVVRKRVRRGTVLVNVRVDRQVQPGAARLNTAALTAYVEQVRAACRGAENLIPGLLAGVLALPGVAPDAGFAVRPPDDEWPLVERVIDQALVKLDAMRAVEGRAMADELLAHYRVVTARLDEIREVLPGVVAGYRERILERVRQVVVAAGATLQPEHVVREVALFADRVDVSEEVTRLASHLDQFASIVRTDADGPGRKLEFVVQEMGRETNTIGSKAGDAQVSRQVVEIKATLEKVRELVQNVE